MRNTETQLKIQGDLGAHLTQERIGKQNSEGNIWCNINMIQIQYK